MAHGVHGGGIDGSPEVIAERVWHMVSSGLSITIPTRRRATGKNAKVR
jgi:hypothetical protein